MNAKTFLARMFAMILDESERSPGIKEGLKHTDPALHRALFEEDDDDPR